MATYKVANNTPTNLTNILKKSSINNVHASASKRTPG